MFLTFDLTCPRCGRPARCEARAGDADPAGEFRFQCPRCLQVIAAPAAAGTPSDVPTPWAVRAA
ncbi:MAG: hypothetical protein C0501_22200 [Isosphaera sp.]|nr:hypothetical protein [Isosphaera sp.]